MEEKKEPNEEKVEKEEKKHQEKGTKKEQKKKKQKKEQKKEKGKKKKKKKNTVFKIIVNLFELLIFVGLVIVIVYLIKSDNGIIGRMNQKTASEKLNAAINNFVSTDTDRDLEEFIREIEGLEEIDVNREQGTMELKIDGQGFLVVVGGSNPEEMQEENATMVEDGIYVEELEGQENSGENQEGNSEENTQSNSEESIENNTNENIENNVQENKENGEEQIDNNGEGSENGE